MKQTAKANVNIALIKYWGKKNVEWNLPLTSSISLTLDKFYTKTTVEYKKELIEDHLYIDDKFIVGSELERVASFMNLIRTIYDIPYFAQITSYNHVPKKAGIASSSSAFAALALAATSAYGINLDKKELSTLARIGSGSAARSIYGGFVIWHEGHNHETSYAEPFGEFEDVAILVCMVDKNEKHIDSRTAMKRLNENKDLLDQWILHTNNAIESMKESFNESDFDKLGTLAESHALLMHWTMHQTGVDYLNKLSFEVIELTENLRKKGIPVYATMDAGPNVKIITKKEYIKEVLPLYEQLTQVTVCYAGEGAILL